MAFAPPVRPDEPVRPNPRMPNPVRVHSNTDPRVTKCCGLKTKRFASLTGTIAFLTMISAVFVNHLYQSNTMGTTKKYGWNSAQYSGAQSGSRTYPASFPDEMVIRCRAWFALAIASMLFAVAAILGTFTSCCKWKTKTLATLFGTSSASLFIGCTVVITYDRPTGLEFGPSPFIGFTASVLMVVPLISFITAR